MFNIFNKSKNLNHVENIAKNSKIQPVYQSGEIKAFLIMLEFTGAELAKSFKNNEAVEEFVTLIEARIKDYDYEDSRLDRTSGRAVIGNIKRVVVSSESTKLFEWAA